MERLLTHLNDLMCLPLAITPMERWHAARPTNVGSGDFTSLYVVILSLLGAVAATLIAVPLKRWLAGRHKGLNEFRERAERAERAGLSEEESNLLTFAAKLGKLRNPLNILTAEAVFHKCVHQLIRCQRVAAMSQADKKKILSVINSARIKLGFDESSDVDVRQISDGVTITLTGNGLTDPVRASIISTQDWEIRAQASGQAAELATGVQLHARYFNAGAVWEFETELIYADGRDLTLVRAKNIRFINRRRFRRVCVDCRASLALFPFLDSEPQKPPVFYPARLMEIGVSGLMLEAEDIPSIPDNSRMLVQIETQPGRNINAAGLLVRTETISSRKSQIVIELTNLSETEMSKLVAATDLAAHQDATTDPSAAKPVIQPAWRS